MLTRNSDYNKQCVLTNTSIHTVHFIPRKFKPEADGYHTWSLLFQYTVGL